MPTGQLEVLMKVVSIFEKLGITYLVGGSFASSAHGIPRATMYIDLLASFKEELAETFARELKSEFYVDVQSIRRAIREERSFNLIHLETMFKVDVFVAKPSGFNMMQLERRRAESLDSSSEQTVYIATAEDIILAKLDWFRKGGDVSEQQWRDILGVIKVQAGGLDKKYLQTWANELGVADLLERALKE